MSESFRRFEILLPLRFNDSPESRQFFVAFKERIKVRFKQADIWMTTYPIEVL